MDAIRDPATLKIQVKQPWRTVQGPIITRQKLVTINVGEIWPGQDYRVPVRMVVPADREARGFHLTGGHSPKNLGRNARPSGLELELLAGGIGLGGNREESSYLGRHWSARGYVAVFVQHPGSDDSVRKGVGLRERIRAMREAASAKNFTLRGQNISAVLDQLQIWNTQSTNQLKGRLDLERVGMSGHSFGARTTQAVSGQSLPLAAEALTEPRIQAAILQSPSSPDRDDPKAAFGGVKIPWLLMTGTKDVSRIGGQTAESRLTIFPALPAGDKYQPVLDIGEHAAFTDQAFPRLKGPRNPNHHRVILALSTAFWDAYLQDNETAKTWLRNSGPRTVLQPKNKWEVK